MTRHESFGNGLNVGLLPSSMVLYKINADRSVNRIFTLWYEPTLDCTTHCIYLAIHKYKFYFDSLLSVWVFPTFPPGSSQCQRLLFVQFIFSPAGMCIPKSRLVLLFLRCVFSCPAFMLCYVARVVRSPFLVSFPGPPLFSFHAGIFTIMVTTKSTSMSVPTAHHPRICI